VAVALGVHVALGLAQGVSAWATGSVGLGASALHAVMGTLAHGIALAGVWMATRPPDRTHPYGYERYEHVAAMAIGMLLLATVAAITVSAGTRLMRPTPLAATGVGAGVMIGSAIANAGLWGFLRHRARALASRVLASEAVHAGADVAMAAAVIAGLVLSGPGMRWLDPIVALGVAGLVTWRGWHLVWASAAVLSDTAGVDVDAIARMAAGIAGVGDVHAVRCRGEFGRVRVDLHIHVDPDLKVAQAHAIAKAVEDRVMAGLGGSARCSSTLGRATGAACQRRPDRSQRDLMGPVGHRRAGMLTERWRTRVGVAAPQLGRRRAIRGGGDRELSR
jgi:cation diffusion facilitator family transporter